MKKLFFIFFITVHGAELKPIELRAYKIESSQSRSACSSWL